MRQRFRRKIELAVGLLAVFIPLLAFGYWSNVGQFAEQMEKQRREVETEREREGMEILKWRHIRETEGSLRSGPVFAEELKPANNTQVNIVGFMVPENVFRDADSFILLPLPIECYFCRMPPVHDVMAIQMAEGTTTNFFDGPVLINGVLRLHEGENQKYFYSITQAAIQPAEKGGEFVNRRIPPEHMLPQHTNEVKLDEGFELEGGAKH